MANWSLEIDRVAPTKRPNRSVWGTQRWRQLLFMHWPVPVAALRRAVPRAFELDLHEGTAYVGVVPFAMQAVRPNLLPAPMSLDFLETNVRTYVHRHGEPGVYFFSLEAASRLAVAAARAAFALPYHFAKMRLEQAQGVVRYRSQRLSDGATLGVSYRVAEALGPSQPGTLEHFLIERYLLFTEREGSALRGQVHHEAYPVHRAEVLAVRDQLVSAAGLPPVVGLPALAHYSPGVDVDVFALERV
jgi:uncharacterized protein YqjF (DUF2071 family)